MASRRAPAGAVPVEFSDPPLSDALRAVRSAHCFTGECRLSAAVKTETSTTKALPPDGQFPRPL